MKDFRTINDTDRRILEFLQDDARTSNAEIARRIGLAPSAVLERIRKLETAGIIRGYTARLDAQALGQGLCAFVFVRTDDMAGEAETAARISRLPGILEVHHIAGEDCFLVKARARDTEALGRLLSKGIGSIPHVRSTRTTIVLETVKESTAIRVEEGAEAGREGTTGSTGETRASGKRERRRDRR